jgi:hypothetical protein
VAVLVVLPAPSEKSGRLALVVNPLVLEASDNWKPPPLVCPELAAGVEPGRENMLLPPEGALVLPPNMLVPPPPPVGAAVVVVELGRENMLLPPVGALVLPPNMLLPPDADVVLVEPNMLFAAVFPPPPEGVEPGKVNMRRTRHSQDQ